MLYQDPKSLEPLEPRKQVRLHLWWKQYIKSVVCLNTTKLSRKTNQKYPEKLSTI